MRINLRKPVRIKAEVFTRRPDMDHLKDKEGTVVRTGEQISGAWVQWPTHQSFHNTSDLENTPEAQTLTIPELIDCANNWQQMRKATHEVMKAALGGSPEKPAIRAALLDYFRAGCQLAVDLDMSEKEIINAVLEGRD